MGVLEHNGRVRAVVVPAREKCTLQERLSKSVSRLNLMLSKSYDGLGAEYAHKVIDHAEACPGGQVHTNGLENF
jgi:hypothetical protein